MRLVLALRLFFRVLFQRDFADQVTGWLKLPAKGVTGAASKEPAAVTPSSAVEQQVPGGREGHATGAGATSKAQRGSSRDSALTLLATLQREARFVDMVMEPLGNYSDAQIGAAARDVLRDCGRVVQRLFDPQPLATVAEGTRYEIARDQDPGSFRVSGNVKGGPPFHGRLVHPGWEAKKCELPQWTGNSASARIIAPLEIEVEN